MIELKGALIKFNDDARLLKQQYGGTDQLNDKIQDFMKNVEVTFNSFTNEMAELGTFMENFGEDMTESEENLIAKFNSL